MLPINQPPIIPTQHKSKIPHTHSYPIGAEAISKVLVGVPQFDDLKAIFSFPKWHSDSNESYPVIDARFSGPLRSFSMPNKFSTLGAGWRITVYAVPRAVRHHIRSKILDEAMASIRTWLVTHTHPSEREGFHRFLFRYDALTRELIRDEHAAMNWKTERID